MHVVIIGNGITGITAATTIRKLSSTHQITVISSESEYFFSRTALMYVYMGHMQYRHLHPYETWFWKENNIKLIYGSVCKVKPEQKQLILEDNKTLAYDKLLIATGSVPNKLNIQGDLLQGIQGFYSRQDLELFEANSAAVEQAVIVGGGLIGIELAEMLYTRCIPVTFLVRESSYWGNILPPEESGIIQNHILAHGVNLKLNTLVQEFISDEAGRVKAVRTIDGDQINCQLVGMAIGVSPNTEWLKNSAIEIGRGILVNEYLETNEPDIYAAGDCAEFRPELNSTPAIEQLWYTGRMQGETVAYSICNVPTIYQRGVWFNSAKFFDIEYQTYGYIPAKPEAGIQSLYWEHASGKKCIRINYKADTQEVTGFNLLGIRYRHEVCERWIKEKKPIGFVLKHLKDANFDPEFHRRHEKDIVQVFNKQITATFAFK